MKMLKILSPFVVLANLASGFSFLASGHLFRGLFSLLSSAFLFYSWFVYEG